jgi:hypothetical protein
MVFGRRMRPIPLEYLVGEPLRAIVEAHGMAAYATSEFILKAGFEPTDHSEAEAGEVRARMFEFTYVQPVPDPANPGAVVHTRAKMSVPVLSLLQVPALGIAEATIQFEARVRDAEKARGAVLAFRNKIAPAAREGYSIQAEYAPKTEAGEGDPTAGSLSITLKVTREPHAEGLAKLLGVLEEASTATPLQT